MRILFATYWYLPHVGGVNTYVNVLRKELIKAGHEVDVFAHHPDMEKLYIVNSGKYWLINSLEKLSCIYISSLWKGTVLSCAMEG